MKVSGTWKHVGGTKRSLKGSRQADVMESNAKIRHLEVSKPDSTEKGIVKERIRDTGAGHGFLMSADSHVYKAFPEVLP